MAKKVSLYESRGETSRYIDAEVRDDGDLVLSGQDAGKAPEEHWGDSDYEWWLVVKTEHKDDVLLALLEAHYASGTATTDLRELLEKKGIPSEFGSWV